MMGESEWVDYQKTDEQLIAEAVAAGRVRKFPMGELSDWDTLSFRDKRKIVVTKRKKKMSTKLDDELPR
jgi:hypothetical protein